MLVSFLANPSDGEPPCLIFLVVISLTLSKSSLAQ